MNKNDVVKVRGKDIGIITISSSDRFYNLRKYKNLNLVELENGRLIAVGDDELEIIQQPVEE